MSENLNTTIDGTQPSSCYRNPTAEKNGTTCTTVAYCPIILVSLAGNTAIGLQDENHEKTHQRFNRNYGHGDFMFAIFLIHAWQIQILYVDCWLISGPLSQVLCKLVCFFQETSIIVSIESLVLIAVDRFGAVVYPLRPPLIRSKLCPILVFPTSRWLSALAKSLRIQSC